MHSKACAIGGRQQAATDDAIEWPLGVTGYAGGKISACCLILFIHELYQNDVCLLYVDFIIHKSSLSC